MDPSGPYFSTVQSCVCTEYREDMNPTTEHDDAGDGISITNRSIVDAVEFAKAQEHDDRNGKFKRSFSPRHVHIISLGANIGAGLFVGIGKALAEGGPGTMVLSYLLAATTVWAMVQTIAEMTIMFPTSGNFVDYAGRWLDPALAFGVGFAEWLSLTAIVASESAMFVILVGLWNTDNAIPPAALITIFMFASSVLFFLPNRVFAWFEYITSIAKLFAFLFIICVSLALVCGAGPTGYVHHGETWTELPAFKNGFGGFGRSCLLAIWAMGAQLFMGIIAGETETPRFSLSQAAKIVPVRVATVYSSCIVFVTLLVRSDNPNLLGGTGVAASPFVIAVREAGIPAVADIITVCIILSILALTAEYIYMGSRILRTLAHQRLIPEFLAKVDDQGRPRWTLAIGVVVGWGLSYLNLEKSTTSGLNWLINISSAAIFCVWIIVGTTSFRFHQALKVQESAYWKAPYAWKSSAGRVAPIWLLITAVFYMICAFYAAIVSTKEDQSPRARAQNFFEYFIGMVLIVAFTIIYKLGMRTKLVDPATADIVTGYRPLPAEEIIMLDNYYSRPRWRRFGAYFKLW
ncbi:hypothetical protein FQN52_003434 [Onygenales sp. PD_12]|nr:hypothetical protein FQN52_003434 [Onygenales sp. PD_12]